MVEGRGGKPFGFPLNTGCLLEPCGWCVDPSRSFFTMGPPVAAIKCADVSWEDSKYFSSLGSMRPVLLWNFTMGEFRATQPNVP